MSDQNTATPIDRAAINRANAAKSTGPKTAAGKQRSSLNAIRHGFTGQTVVLPSEDMQAYLAFSARFVKELKPKGILEEQFTQTIADTSWRLNRLRADQANLFALSYHDQSETHTIDDPVLHTALTNATAREETSYTLSRLSLYEQRLTKILLSAQTTLNKMQAERREHERKEMHHAMKMRIHYQRKEPNWQPAEDGFVFSIEEIDTEIRRTRRRDKAFFAAS